VINLNIIIDILKDYVQRSKTSVNIILVGGLALHYYGMHGRSTIDLDAEIKGDIEPLLKFLKQKKIPADLGEDLGRWSIVAMPPGYRRRVMVVYKDRRLIIKVLHPLDFVISKLRRFTEEDLVDALFVVRKYSLKPKEIEVLAKKAMKNSPKDTFLFTFEKNLKYFLQKLH
jgi:hypothetical protein